MGGPRVAQRNALGEQWCKLCQSYLSLDEFPPSMRVAEADLPPPSRRSECTVCRRLRYFKLTREQFAALPGANAACPICQMNPSTEIDHDHLCCPGRYSCGKCARAVLCTSCNLLAGRIEALFRAGYAHRMFEHLAIPLKEAS